jgi:hypothetical protein
MALGFPFSNSKGHAVMSDFLAATPGFARCVQENKFCHYTWLGGLKATQVS